MSGERVYLRGRVYWGWYYVGKERVCRSTRCRDKRAAEAVVRGWERGDVGRAALPTLKEAFAWLAADREGRGRSAGTLNMYETKAGQIMRILGETTPVAHVTAAKVDDYIAQRLREGRKRTTIARELTAISGMLKVARRRGEFPRGVDEVMPHGWAPEYKPVERWLPPAELDALLAALPAGRRGHVSFIVATSARDAEAAAAQAGDIDRARGAVRLRGTKTAGAARTVPIVGPFVALLEGVEPPFASWGNVRRDLHEACARAGIPPCSPNDLRRTTAKWLRNAGVEPHLIAAVLGHRDSRMVERVYGKIDTAALGKALRERMRA